MTQIKKLTNLMQYIEQVENVELPKPTIIGGNHFYFVDTVIRHGFSENEVEILVFFSCHQFTCFDQGRQYVLNNLNHTETAKLFPYLRRIFTVTRELYEKIEQHRKNES